MKEFEVSVQSLATMEHHLQIVEPPPSYSKAAEDRIVIDKAGNIRHVQ